MKILKIFLSRNDDSEMCMIYDVIVHPHYQKKGGGTLLMNEVLK